MIYILEDDSTIRELVIYTLNHMELEATGFECPSLFWEGLSSAIPDLILLDIMLPEESGLEVLKKLKSNDCYADIPVIMLTAKGAEYDKVMGLDSGADDYVAKPFGMMELVSRIKALLRRTGKKSDKKEEHADFYKFGDTYIYTKKHQVKCGDEEINLTLKEYDLLLALLEDRGNVFTRDQLLNKIWGYDFDGESRTVDVHIRTLRAKLGENGNFIETVRGVGYRIGDEHDKKNI